MPDAKRELSELPFLKSSLHRMTLFSARKQKPLVVYNVRLHFSCDSIWASPCQGIHTMQKISFRSVSLAIAAFAIALQSAVAVASNQSSSSDRNPANEAELLYSETIDSGLMVIDKTFISAPYLLEATETHVSVNGIVCFNSGEVSSSQARSRRQRSADGETQQGDFATSGRTRRSAVRTAEQLVETLMEGGAIFISDDKVPHHLLGSGYHLFCDVILAEQPTDDQVFEFSGLVGDVKRQVNWKEWLQTVVVPESARTSMQATVDEINRTEADGIAKMAALQRLESMSYPLTVLGMLLSVFALGHVLKWTAKSIVAEQNADYTPEVTKCVEVALLLMLAMSLIDLVWTILAGQAGVMKEVNPLAATYLDSPMQLVAFKVTATGLGCGILYAWRRLRQVQDATWWMCLVCVLLTFRWVVFDSVMG